MNWDDLRFILAVARHGTITDGARALRLNATTVSRRLRAMEEEAGTALFDKLKHGAVLTSAGEEIAAAAETIEEVANALDGRIIGLDAKLDGTLRVSAPHLPSGDGFATSVISAVATKASTLSSRPALRLPT
ncbi:MAG: LysR family transcriptional regulator [Myxococcales bacterium]|nr:LysR family transcriptional regulator [Myxococcales bacterium]